MNNVHHWSVCLSLRQLMKVSNARSTHVINDVDVARESTCDLGYRVCIKKPATDKLTAIRSKQNHFNLLSTMSQCYINV